MLPNMFYRDKETEVNLWEKCTPHLFVTALFLFFKHEQWTDIVNSSQMLSSNVGFQKTSK